MRFFKTQLILEFFQKNYTINTFGPIYLAWGKRRFQNDKGKFVKKFYIKKAEKHRIWVKWQEVFKDEIALENDGLKGKSKVVFYFYLISKNF